MNELLPLIEVSRSSPRDAAARIRGRFPDLTTVEKRADEIIRKVRSEGDAALFRYSRELDRAEIGGKLRVEEDGIREAARRVDPKLKEAMRFSLDRIRKTQSQLLQRLAYAYVSNGFVVRCAPIPIESVGCYVPGGRASYASSVLMTAGLAKLAGVKRIVLCTPPGRDGRVDDAILAAAEACGVDETYRIGGAQSIAALAYGTETIAKVDKVVGPGGVYVSVAKRLVSRDVSTDFFAGPTEIVVVGDESADPKLVAWDLVGQAEHGEDTLCCFVTWHRPLAERVRVEVTRIAKDVERGEFVRAALGRGSTAFCADRDAALGLVNAIAPEHLEVMVKDPKGFSDGVRSAGLVLVGKYAPCAASDYCIGTDHVIPTRGTASSRAGLSVLDFVKLNWSVEGTRDGLRSVLPSLEALSRSEGLPNHFRSARARFRR